jgi:hypothetical protein
MLYAIWLGEITVRHRQVRETLLSGSTRIACVLLGKVARPERLELPTLWFEDTQYKTLSAASGVAYRGTRHLSRS